MKISTISTDQAPAAIGPYAQAVRAGGLMFCSGQIALDPVSGELDTGDAGSQTARVMNNIKAVLAATGAGLGDIVKTTIYLVDMDDFAAVNQVYGSFLGDHRPARSTVAVKGLPKGAKVEIEVIALL